MSMTHAAMLGELLKLAQEPVEPQEELPEPKPAKPPHPGWRIAKNVGAFGLGAGAGLGTGMLANEISRRARGKKLIRGTGANVALPVATGLGAVLLSAWQNNLMDKLREDSAKRRELSRGG